MKKFILNTITWIWIICTLLLVTYSLNISSADSEKSTPAGIGVYATARVELITGFYFLFFITPYLIKFCLNKFNVPNFSQIPFRLVYSVFPPNKSSIFFALLILFFGLVGIIRGLKGI